MTPESNAVHRRNRQIARVAVARRKTEAVFAAVEWDRHVADALSACNPEPVRVEGGGRG